MYVLIPVYYAASCGEYNPKRDLKNKVINDDYYVMSDHKGFLLKLGIKHQIDKRKKLT